MGIVFMLNCDMVFNYIKKSKKIEIIKNIE